MRYIVLPVFSKSYIVSFYFIFLLEGVSAIFFDENVENIFLNKMISFNLWKSYLKAIFCSLNSKI